MTLTRTSEAADDEIELAQPPSAVSPTRRRTRVAVIGALATAAVSVTALAASVFVKSPAEQMAETAAPAPNVLTAPVQHIVLASTIVMRGAFAPGRLVQVAPATIAATAGNPSGSGNLVVTALPVAQGQRIRPGQVLAEYSDRPVYALTGAVPAYRDMEPGESGPDVAELQKALAQLGFSSGPDPSGTFGTGTADAVTRFYAGIGYPAPIAASTGGHPAGPIVPLSEAVFLPSFPAYVETIGAQVGDPVSKSLLTLAVGGLTLTGELDPAQAGLVKQGMKAAVLSEATGLEADGVVAGPGTAPAANSSGATQDASGAAGGDIPLRISPAKPWAEGFDGQDVRITITSASTGTAVLAVPEAAVFTGANTRTYVTVLTSGGHQQQVPVQAGASADGLVQVTPLGARLTPGEQVVVGQ